MILTVGFYPAKSKCGFNKILGKQGTTMKNKMTTIAASAGLLLGATSLVQAEGSKLDSVKTTLSSILAKEGISFSGEFRSEFHQGTINDDQVDETLDPTTESLEYTSVDFAITARPNSNVSGTAMFRMHQDWRNFFSDISNPITTRWVSIDGNFGNILGFNLGDFKTKYSPLTVWSPEEHAMYEADIFKQDRLEAQKEYFLGDNERLMQGANLNLDAGVEGVLDELHVGVFGSRLRNVNVESQVANINEAATLEKFAFGSNLDLSVKGIDLGGSYIKVFDRKSTYTGLTTDAAIINRDISAEDLTVYAGRGGFNLNNLQESNVIFSANAELAWATDNVGYLRNTADTVASKENLEGSALLATGVLGYGNKNDYKVVATVNYLKNDKNFYNPLAQSPTVEVAQIMNVQTDIIYDPEQLVPQVNSDIWNNHYSIYDNFHNHAFKFTPSEETNMWHKAPFSKNAYTNKTFNRQELSQYSSIIGFNGFKPAGLASSNRTGVSANLKVNALNNALTLKGVVDMLEEVEGATINKDFQDNGNRLTTVTDNKTKFSIMGGGLSVDVMKLAGQKKPLILSGSMILKTVKRDAQEDIFLAENDVKIALVNAGLYYSFWNRFSLLGGYQTTHIQDNISLNDWKEAAMAMGLEYKLATGLYAIVKFTRLDVEKTSSTLNETAEVVPSLVEYSQDFVKAAIRVQF